MNKNYPLFKSKFRSTKLYDISHIKRTLYLLYHNKLLCHWSDDPINHLQRPSPVKQDKSDGMDGISQLAHLC